MLNTNVDKLMNRLFLWCMLSVAAGILILLLSSLLVYMIYGCWPLARVDVNNCLSRVPLWGQFLPIILAGAIGFIWSGKTKIKIPSI